MQYLGIEYSIKNRPALDADFIPFGVWAKAYLNGASCPFKIAVERENGLVSVFETKLRGAEFAEANYRYAERFVKMLLWSVGGWKVYLCGDDAIAKRMQDEYRMGGKREFDVQFMQDVYERPFEIVICDESHFPQAHEQTKKVGGHTNGCRIGFDAGGSDRKVSAVIDGEPVYSEEVVWHPKTSEDPQYQYDGIVAAFKTAASKLPRVDGIGVSSAGVFIGNAPMVSSIFIKVPRSRREEVKTIYDRAAKELGDIPIVVANDGDVSALAGAMSLGAGCVMGLAMGTSEAVGYILLRDVKRVPYEELYLDPDKLAKEFDAAHPAAIVENDCVIVTGESLLQAFDRLEVMELTAASILKSQRLGRMVHISDEEVAALKETFMLYWQYERIPYFQICRHGKEAVAPIIQ